MVYFRHVDSVLYRALMMQMIRSPAGFGEAVDADMARTSFAALS